MRRALCCGMLLCGLAAVAVAEEPLALPTDEKFDAGADARWQKMSGTWEFTNGAVKQTSEDYDCGLSRGLSPGVPFYFSVRYKPDSAFDGGGLFFGLPKRDSKVGGIMVRMDPDEGLLWGKFAAMDDYQVGGTLQVTATTEAQELAVAVDPTKNCFNLYFNGKRIGTNLSVEQATGFIGIESSGGPHSFTAVTVRAATPQELEGLAPPAGFARTVDLIGNAMYMVLLRDGPACLQQVAEDGVVILSLRTADVPGVQNGLRPVSLCWDDPNSFAKETGLYALVEGGQAIYRFDDKLRVQGKDAWVRVPGMQGRGIAADGQGHVFVADASIPGIRVFAADPNGSGAEIAHFGRLWARTEQLSAPAAAAAGAFKSVRSIGIRRDGVLAVVDREQYTYLCYRYDAEGKTFKWVSNGPWLPGLETIQFDPNGLVVLPGKYEYYAPYGALRVVTLDGHPVNVYKGAALGDLPDRLRACAGPGKSYWLLNQRDGTLLCLPVGWKEELPQFEWEANGGVKLTLTNVYGHPLTASSGPPAAGAKRGEVAPPVLPLNVFPPPHVDTLRKYSLPVKPTAGKKYVIDMPVLVAIFTHSKNTKTGQETKIDGTGAAERLA